ncbi:EcWRKY-24, partial [Eragrostis curvula]
MASRSACAASELVAKGKESAAILQALLSQQPAAADEMPEDLNHITEQILRCCDRALAALRSGTEEDAGDARKRKLVEHGPAAAPHVTTSSKRMRSGGEKGGRVEKQRTLDDGFIWRKYGQKEICDSKYPWLYFRCTYKEDRGCMAKRQVQRSEADPSVYFITYFGEHTCGSDDDEPLAPFVINFGSSTRDGHQPNVSPWPSSQDDGLAVSETSSDLCNSPQEELLTVDVGDVAELIEKSSPAPAPAVTSSPGWDPRDGCLDWDLLVDDYSSFDIGQFINYEYLGLLQ